MEAAQQRSFFQRHPISMWIHDQDSLVLLDANEKLLKDLGYGISEFLGMKLGDLLPETEKPHLPLDLKLGQPPGQFTTLLHIRCKDGQIVTYDSIHTILDEKNHNHVLVTLLPHHDSSLEKRTLEARLRISEFSYSHALDELLQKTLDEAEILTGSTIGFFHFVEGDQQTIWLQNWSTNTLKHMCKADGKLQHYDIDEAGVWVDCVGIGRPVIHNDYPNLVNKKGLPQGHAPLSRILTIPIIRTGKVVAILGVGNKPIEYTDTDVESANLLADLAWDITVRKREEEQIHYLAFVMGRVPSAIISTDRDLHITHWNAAAEELYGWSEHEVLGREINEICQTEFLENQQIEGEQIMLTEKKWQAELKQHHRNGTEIWVDASVTMLEDEHGKFIGGVTVNHDITERKRAENDLHRAKNAIEEINQVLQRAFEREQLASRTDGLTGVFNRRHFHELFEYEFSASIRYQRPLSIVMFDIDHFKRINDTYGHLAGDEVLKCVAKVVREQLRDSDILARYGGDEFVILLPSSDSQEAALVLERIYQIMQSFEVTVQEEKIRISLSSGIASLQLNMELPSQLLQMADQALYSAKRAGGNCFFASS